MSHVSVHETRGFCDGVPTLITADQCRMARAALRLGVRELAAASDVAVNTITRLEKGEGIHSRNGEAIHRALEAAGVEFIAGNGDGPGVRLLPRIREWMIDLARGRLISPHAVGGLYYYPDQGRYGLSNMRATKSEYQGREVELANSAASALDEYYSVHPEMLGQRKAD